MQFLYRFRPDNKLELETLARGDVFFNHVSGFEDKEEFTALFEIFHTNFNDTTNTESNSAFAEYCKKMYGSIGKWVNNAHSGLNQSFKERIEEQIRCYWRVACFTTSYKNEHMWNCYARRTGFCIEYAFAEVKEKSDILREISYSDDKVVLKSSNVDPIILTTKTTKWKVEDEIRALTFTTSDEHFSTTQMEWFTPDDDYAYCYHDVLEVPQEEKRSKNIDAGIKSLYFKAKKKVFRAINPKTIITTRHTTDETKKCLIDIAKQLNCLYREFQIQ